ncbi:hypothetical protein CSS82_20690 [Salmonella enterica subsp. enterica serovar Kentucky]|nr:hypothetical protein [Salmonella enterica subsp. enterica serovar Kentucky]EDW3026079.1 hypothetical protein [Salmonella enterica subsp. enterica serovar Kentucky]
MPAFEWVHVQLHQQKGMISLSPPTICNSAHLITRRIVYQIKSSITFPILPGKAVSIIRYRPQQDSVRLSILQDLTRYREK